MMRAFSPRPKAVASPARTFAVMLCAWMLVGCTTVDPAARQAQATVTMCSACHGNDGTSQSARAPILAAQQPAYLIEQLQAFRDHTRADPDARAFMWPMATALSDPAVENLANHFAALPAVPGRTAASGDAEQGKKVYEQGAADRGIPPCSSCHGDKGVGMAVFPRLAGQHDDYLSGQLDAFAAATRVNPIMGPIATRMSADEIANVSAYLALQ